MEKNCFNCKYYDQPSFEMKEYCWECLRQEEVYARWERKPITNADRFRAMTDEELADWLAKQEYRRVAFDGWLPLCNHVMGAKICHENGCNACWLEWLKEEATE